MRHLTRVILGSLAAVTLVVGMAAPAAARNYHRHHHRSSGFGNFLAGALVVGTIAAIASSSSKRDRAAERTDLPPPPPPQAFGVDENDDNGLTACAATAEREAQRYTRDNARVVEIRAVDNSGRNTRFTGRVEVADDGYSGGRPGYDGVRRESARFTCTAEYGQVNGFIFDDGFGFASR